MLPRALLGVQHVLPSSLNVPPVAFVDTNVASRDSNAVVTIKNGDTAVENGSSATWSEGENILTITVTNGSAIKTYAVTVTKE